MSPQEILALFGQPVVLLKLADKGKRPLDPGWQNKTLADMTEAYHASLNGNIGILNGAASGGLHGIEWDDKQNARMFLDANPWAKECLWSMARRGPCFWVFLDGPYPANHQFYDADGNQIGEWRSDGRQTVFCGTHPEGMPYRNNGKRPARIRYSDIVWPPGIFREKPAPPPPPFDDGPITARVGPPFWTDRDGVIVKMNWQYFIERFCAENLVLFEQDEGAFFRYLDATGAWHKVVSDVIKETMREDYQRLTREWQRREMEGKVNNGAYNSLTNGIQSRSGRTKVFAPLTRVIHCANGMLHLLDNGEWDLREFHPDYFARNPTPINWNPEAKAPKFQAILDTMEPADADLLLRYAANVLLGGNPSQQILLLTGEGGTSKSTACEAIELVVGRQNVAELRTEHLDNRFEIGRYVGKTLLSGKDVKGNFLQSEGASRIKALTGHDMLTGEIKCEMGTPEVYGQFAIIITCNERLTVKLEGETDMSAWSRRLMHIEFTAKSKHKEIIPNYAKKMIAEEGEGILLLIVKAAFRHLKELDTIGTFYQTPAQKARIDDLLAESRSIELFVKECVFSKRGSDISSDELVNAYNRHCEFKGWEPFAAPLFQKYVVTHMVRCHKSNKGTHCEREINGVTKRVNGYPNVTLIEEDSTFEDDFPGFTGESQK
jgi:phage/plasmid-associated DNA primase